MSSARFGLFSAVICGFLASSACSGTGAGGGGDETGGAAGAAFDGGGTAGVSGASNAGSGGTAGTITLDGGGTGGTLFDGSDCAGIAVPSTPVVVPADIIFGIDTSTSMREEVDQVRANMNAFSKQLTDARVNARFVLVAQASGQDPFGAPVGICIDKPLGSGNCPLDEQPPRYRHVAQPVSSTDALYAFKNHYDRYKTVLRPDSLKIFVVVSDADTAMPADEFTVTMDELDPTTIKRGFWKFHAIVPFRACAGIATGVGTEYLKLVNQTRGVAGDLCRQQFQPVFDQLAQDAIAAVNASCTWDLPDPPAGQAFNPRLVNFDWLRSNGTTVTIGKVPGRDDCTVKGGWYYDDDANPKAIVACPATCSDVTGATTSSVVIRFGCATQEVPR